MTGSRQSGSAPVSTYPDCDPVEITVAVLLLALLV